MTQSTPVPATDDDNKRMREKVDKLLARDPHKSEGSITFGGRALAYDTVAAFVPVNAGGPPPGRFDDLDDAKWHAAVELTLMSAVRLTRFALPELRKSKGSIVYSTSTSVRQPTQYLNLILSNAIRAAVHGMLKTLSKDLAPDGIRVNAVQPGRIATDRLIELDTVTAKATGKSIEEVRKGWESNVIPLGRYGRPEEFATAVVFMASPRASYITGVSHQVDGGMLMSLF